MHGAFSESKMNARESISLKDRTNVQLLRLYYQRHARELLIYANQSLRDQGAAEDVLHDAFIIAARKIETLESESVARAWLYGIVKNLCRDFKKRGARRKTECDDMLDERVAEQKDQGYHHEVSSLVHQILDGIDPIFREVLILCELQGLKAREAAELLDCSPNTISSRLRIGRQRFREIHQELMKVKMKESQNLKGRSYDR